MLATELYYVARHYSGIIGKTSNGCFNDIIGGVVAAARSGKMLYHTDSKLTHGCIKLLRLNGFQIEKKHIGNGIINYTIIIPAPTYYPDTHIGDTNCMSHWHEE